MRGNVRHLLRLAWVFRLLLSLFVSQRRSVLRRQYFNFEYAVVCVFLLCLRCLFSPLSVNGWMSNAIVKWCSRVLLIVWSIVFVLSFLAFGCEWMDFICSSKIVQ